MRLLPCFLVVLFYAILPVDAFANHILGGEINYRYLADNGQAQTYRVRLSFFADCSSNTGSSNAFSALVNADPIVKLYDKDILVSSNNLTYIASESDIEITPVCADEEANTACKNINNPIPGIKKFVYEGDFVLKGRSENWRFAFEGSITRATIAGRSFIIQNALVADSSTTATIMFLEATLNNMLAANNSTAFTSLPTPFFCVNKASSYSLGAADAEQDSLVFSLIPAKKMAGTNQPPVFDVTYIAPYTAKEPLPVVAGSFDFNTRNGQMNFVPNKVLNCLVTNLVEEYRNGIKVGSSMREMDFVILDNCNNNAATSPVENVQHASSNMDLAGNLSLSVCEGQLEDISFDIKSTDPDNDNTTISYNNLPSGALITIDNNKTPNPLIHFKWNAMDALPGDYIFYITYTDDGCPLVSTKTVAYTVTIVPHPNKFVSGFQPTCVGTQAGKIWVVPALPMDVLYNYRWVNQDATTLQERQSLIGDTLDRIGAGTFKVYIRDAEGCGTNVAVDLNEIPLPEVALREDTTLCVGMPIALGVAVQEQVAYLWNTGADTCCIEVNSPGIYSVQAINTCGSASDEVVINYERCDFCLFVPNAFSPNGDGQNDYFKILETCLLTKFKLQIFNRWGQVVFSSFSSGMSWDGIYKGQPAETGSYFYYIEAEPLDKNKEIVKLKGDLILIR